VTDNALDARERALEIHLAGWQHRAAALVARKLGDAEAHATKALTDTLKRHPDGRPTLRRAASSVSYQAATGRLTELLTGLAGPSRYSTVGLLRDACEDCYARAFEAWRPFIPESLWARPDGQPTAANLLSARTLVVHGYDLRAELAGPIAAASQRLLAVVAQAAARTTPEHVETDLVETWRRQSEAGLTTLVKRVLSDWQKAADTRAGRDLVHADYLDDTAPEA
jgi:hypothetical protein